MKWKKYTFETTTKAVDIISAVLGEIGIEGIEVEDNVALTEEETKGMFIDILPELPQDDGTAKISFYLDFDKDNTDLLNAVKESLEDLREFIDIGKAEIVESETEDKDWINNWKEFFKPFKVGEVLIKPSWEEIPKDLEYKTLINIDPKTAFGTGGHETTRLCIKQLEKYIDKLNKNDEIKVLDVGTGSGILGIAALKLGSKYVFGTDLDDMVVNVVQENMEINDITSSEFETICGNIIDDINIQEKAGFEKYDIVVANILAPVIVLLQEEVYKHLKHGGIFIASGIIDEKEEFVKLALSKNKEFEILETTYDGEWVSITAKRI